MCGLLDIKALSYIKADTVKWLAKDCETGVPRQKV
jgi:hypothetical protein